MALRGFHQRMILASVVMSGVFAPSVVVAENSDQGSQIAARVVSFLTPPPKGPVTAAIVYDPGNSGSTAEAAAIERDLRGGLTVGSLTLVPKRVPMTGLGGLAGAKVAFVTRGTNYRAIAAAAAPQSIVTITSDTACVRAGYCIVAISARPKVEITVSRAAQTAAHIRFSAAFLMLVKEF